jgi:hypothetical protein
MSESIYEKYVVRKPLYEVCAQVKNRQSPTMTFMSERQVPGVPYYVQLGWINGIPDPNPHVFEHKHDFDEVILFWGGNWETPQDLGGEIEFFIGGQPITFNTNVGIFIPKGTLHGPLTWKKFGFSHVQMNLLIGTGSATEGWSQSGIDIPKGLPQKKIKFDYEQYVIRSPLREAAPQFKGLQSPSMTYMSSVQINAANLYIDYAWVKDIVQPPIGQHVHNQNDEIVLHIGSDPDNPEDLGADMTYGIGGDLLKHSNSYVIYLPKGLRHGPLTWQKFRRPHIEMAIVFGVGTLQQRASNSTRLN